MKGHQHLIDQRKRGIHPTLAFIYDQPYLPNWVEEDHSPEITIHDEKALDRLDVRFLKGMYVFAYVSTKERAIALFEALLKARCDFVSVTWQGEIRQKHYWSRMYDARTGFEELEEANELST
jgi:hypothetical protein